MEKEQNRTEYEPTAAEKRLLDVLINPENRRKTVVDICALADIGRTTYYEIIAKEEFEKLKRKWVNKLISSNTLQVIHANTREALRGSAPHIKMHLEIDGVYKEKIQQEISGPGGEAIKVEAAIDYSSANNEELICLKEACDIVAKLKGESEEK